MGFRRPVVLVVALVALVALVVPVVVAAPARAIRAAAGWVRPVDGRVVRRFDPPRTRFGPGHLGVDLAAAPGTPVHAAGAGEVTFAGDVAGAQHVVVAHDGGLRTSYSFLASVSVRRGQTVRAGQVVGTTGGHGVAHDGTVLHVGLRAGDRYLDPMLLFDAVDLATVVHLVPARGAPGPEPVARERRGLLDGLRGVASFVVAAGGATGGRVGRVAGAAAGIARRGLRLLSPSLDDLGRSMTSWLRERMHCDSHAPRADGTGGSGHRVMVVAGIDSRTGKGGASLDLPTDALGYQRDEVTYFSYAPRGGPYTKADTHEPLLDAARQLGAQLRALQRREPGREVDLIAHSQGGVVVVAFLALVYDPADPSYPPLGTVVTLSSPLAGAPLATAGAHLARSRSGRAFLATVDELATRAGAPIPPARAPSVRDLAEGSPLMRRIGRAGLPGDVDLTTIGAVADPVVPGSVATRPGARHTIVATGWANAHRDIVADADAMRTVRAALEHRPVPCRPWATALAAGVVPPALVRAEHDVGTVGAAVGHLADLGW